MRYSTTSAKHYHYHCYYTTTTTYNCYYNCPAAAAAATTITTTFRDCRARSWVRGLKSLTLLTAAECANNGFPEYVHFINHEEHSLISSFFPCHPFSHEEDLGQSRADAPVRNVCSVSRFLQVHPLTADCNTGTSRHLPSMCMRNQPRPLCPTQQYQNILLFGLQLTL